MTCQTSWNLTPTLDSVSSDSEFVRIRILVPFTSSEEENQFIC